VTKTGGPIQKSRAVFLASVTYAVVLPNMLATMRGFSEDAGDGEDLAVTMPPMAPPALVNMARETRLRPETSTMAGIILMSVVPT